MEIKLDSKLLKAVSGLFFFAISIILMACGGKDLYDLHWLVGLFLMFNAAALCGAWYLDGKKDNQLAAVAGLYFFFAIVFFANKPIMINAHLFAIWAMLEAALVAADGMKAKEENANLWFVPACLGALGLLLGFIACFAMGEEFYGNFMGFGDKSLILPGLALLFVSLAKIFPVILPFLPKVELKK